MLETILKPDDTAERCGLVLKDGSIVEIDNISENPDISYKMDPDQVLPYLQRDEVAGTWHTHPDSDPTLSGADYEGFLLWPGWEHSIVGRRDGAVAVTKYRVEDGLVIACT